MNNASFVPDAYLENDRAALEMGRLAAQRLSPKTLATFRGFLESMRSEQPSRYIEAWLGACDEGPESVRRILIDTTHRGQIMRSVISFRPFVQKEERDVILRANFVDRGNSPHS